MDITGRIDVHSHLLPCVDDGCASLAESLDCARRMVAAGYTDSFCTPHYWPNLKTSTTTVPQWTSNLQTALDSSAIPLRLHPGGEINLRPGLSENDPAGIVSYGMKRKYALIDLLKDIFNQLAGPVSRHLYITSRQFIPTALRFAIAFTHLSKRHSDVPCQNQKQAVHVGSPAL